MENKKIVNLSFDDNRMSIRRVIDTKRGDTKVITVASIVSYFRADKIQKFLQEAGHPTMPEAVLNVLNKYGYTYDYKLNGWVTKVSASIVLDAEDEDDEVKANHISMTKAKVKSYDRAYRCLKEIKNVFVESAKVFEDSKWTLAHYLGDENDALDRAIETGYCNPNKK